MSEEQFTPLEQEEPLEEVIDEDFQNIKKEESGIINDKDVEEPEPKEQVIKLKVNGKEIEEPLSEVIKKAQLYNASAIKLESLKEAKANVDAKLQQVQVMGQILKSGNIDNISEMFNSLGIDFNTLAIMKTKQLFEHEQMSPEQKEAIRMKTELERLKKQQEFQKQTEFQRVQQYHEQKALEELQVEIPKALQNADLVGTPEVISRIAQVWQSAIRQGKNPTATQVVKFVKSQIDHEQENILKSFDTNKLKSVLGDKAVQIAKELMPKKTFTQSDRFKPAAETPKKPTYIRESEWSKR